MIWKMGVKRGDWWLTDLPQFAKFLELPAVPIPLIKRLMESGELRSSNELLKERDKEAKNGLVQFASKHIIDCPRLWKLWDRISYETVATQGIRTVGHSEEEIWGQRR
jgi:hypothetical protein